MKRWLVIPLVLLMLRRVNSQNNVTGNALPCGDDNLSCINPGDPDNPDDCLTRDQLCNGNDDCPDGLDEGNMFASLDCLGIFGNAKEFRCTGGENVGLEDLCDGVNQCESGEDERSIICENKCRLPYYGACDFTRECVTTEFGQNCGNCMTGYTDDETGIGGGPCIPAVFLTLDSNSYSASEGVPNVEVCVEGSLGTGSLDDIAGESFVVDLVLFNGTAIGGGIDFYWSSSPAILTLVFDSANLLTPQCFNISINDDQEVEPEEFFSVSLLELRNDPRGRASLVIDEAVVSIADNDVESNVSASLKKKEFSISEAEGARWLAIYVCVNLTGRLTTPVTVQLGTVAGSAEDPMDFPSTTHDLTFNPDNRTSRCECGCFTIHDDNFLEGEETFIISLTSDDPVVVINEECDEAIVTIIDDEEANVCFKEEMYTVMEDDGIATVCVQLTYSGALVISDPITVFLKTADISAEDGYDYKGVCQELVFTPHDGYYEMCLCTDIEILDDSKPEALEKFRLFLDNADSTMNVNTDCTSAVVIVDDDEADDETNDETSDNSGSGSGSGSDKSDSGSKTSDNSGSGSGSGSDNSNSGSGSGSDKSDSGSKHGSEGSG